MVPNLDIWLNHFEHHSRHLRAIPENLPDVLTPEERSKIARSIATFQLGERSEGRTLLRAAQRFAQTYNLAPLVRITELFIQEEQQHAALLRVFMENHAIPVKRRDWTDQIFRRARSLAGFELCISVLITAELIGNVYYRALEVATGSRYLRALCNTLVADELAHIAYEAELILAMRASKPRFLRITIDLAHRAFFLGAALIVWYTHRPVLKLADYRMSAFLRACRTQYSFYLDPQSPYLASSRGESS